MYIRMLEKKDIYTTLDVYYCTKLSTIPLSWSVDLFHYFYEYKLMKWYMQFDIHPLLHIIDLCF